METTTGGDALHEHLMAETDTQGAAMASLGVLKPNPKDNMTMADRSNDVNNDPPPGFGNDVTLKVWNWNLEF